MFRDIELPFKLTLLEALSIVAFAAIGYSVIYKLGYYSTLDITWFMYELTPINIVFSSILFIIIFSISISMGFLLYKIIRKIDNKVVFSIVLGFILLTLILIFILSSPLVWDLNIIDFLYINHKYRYLNLWVICMIVVLVIMNAYDERINNINGRRVSNKYLIISSMCLLIIYPFTFGTIEGSSVLRNKETALNLVEIKDGSKWYLIHYYNDKFLLLSEGEKNLYKIVEYKDVNVISMNKPTNSK